MKNGLLRAYDDLMARYRECFIFSSAQDILSWDMMTKLPPRGIGLRGDQLHVMSGIGRRLATSPAIGRLLARIEQDPAFQELDPVGRRNVQLIRKSFDEQKAVPERLIAEMARQNAITYDAWKKAKPAGDWRAFLPELEKNVALAKQKAALLMEVKQSLVPYDALIDVHESGMTSRRISSLFDRLWSGLRLLIEKVADSPTGIRDKALKCEIPLDMQRRIAAAVAEAVGYDITSNNAGGRIDEAEHPFTSGYYGDVRVTTHYYECDFTSSVFSVLHEAGHALYEQGLNPEWTYIPVGAACSTGLHESQSRFLENIIGRSVHFWAYFFPRLQEITGPILSGIDLDEFVRAINHVKRSRIRVEADEVTYSVHGIIRFDIERELFADRVAVRELPELWNESYRRYLGVEAKDHAEGIMQDMHWADGSYGYFPCYVLGNIYDGHLLAKMSRDLPKWEKELETGNIIVISDWLNKNVHSLGNLYDPVDLIRVITGEEVSEGPYLKYLNEKYA